MTSSNSTSSSAATKHRLIFLLAMSGLGRRTPYRKHLTDSVLHDFPEPAAERNEWIAKVIATRGSNQFDVGLPQGAPVLALLPTKFRKLIWLKRNDFVIVQSVDDAEESGEEAKSGIRYMIAHILYKPQIQHLMDRQLWPTDDPAFAVAGMAFKDASIHEGEGDDGIVYATRNTTHRLDDNDDLQDNDEEEEYEDSDNDDDLFVNTNRIRQIVLKDSSSDDDEEEEEYS
jgi:probable RNA-binding protein EIF1AD